MEKSKIKPLIFLALYAMVLWAAFFVFGEEYGKILSFYAAFLFVSLPVLPVVFVIFKDFPGRGISFAKPLGLAMCGLCTWGLCVFRIVPFSRAGSITVSCVLMLIVMGGLLLYIRFASNKGKAPIFKGKASMFKGIFTGELFSNIIIRELIFLVIFLVWCYIKGSKPSVYGTEKFMDYGFMMAMDRSSYMPVEDIWFSGFDVNYYYVGIFMATLVTKISGVGVAFGYNLMLAILPAICFMGCFCVAEYLLSKVLSDEKGSFPGVLSCVGGVVAGLAGTIAGNMHYVLFGLLKIPSDDESYWFPDSTRYIGYNPDTDDKTIHEFPSYSFILGDLHAHVINYIFVITFIGILLACAFRMNLFKDDEKNNGKYRHNVLGPIVLGVFLGLFQTSNYWDFPIYWVVASAVFIWFNFLNRRGARLILIDSAIDEVLLLGISYIVSIPFRIHFDMITTQIHFTDRHTPIYQLMVLWGLPALLIALFIIACILVFRKPFSEGILGKSDSFMVIIACCGLGLLLLPELIYVKDIYNDTYQRTNTMFKLTYQAYILFALCFGYMLVRLIACAKKAVIRAGACVCAFLFILTLGYFPNASSSWFGGVLGSGFETLYGPSYLETDMMDYDTSVYMTDDKAAIDWINENIDYPCVILEADGDSYTFYERISAMTGFPTVLGWKAHEHLWRMEEEDPEAMPQIITERQEDVKTIYTGTDEAMVRELVEKYGIDYIVVGYNERTNYEWEDTGVNETLIGSLGEKVFVSGEGSETEIYIIKVDK